MAYKVISGEELKPLPSPDSPAEDQVQQKQPKLTMKFLHELIRELQRENRLLAKRVEELQQQMIEFQNMQQETAAAAEVPIPQPIGTLPMEIQVIQPDVTQTILVPRSIRHPAPKKKPFWAFLFRLKKPNTKRA